MIPAPPRISAPPRRESRPRLRPQLAPRLTTQTSPTLPPRHKRFPPTAPPVPARPHPTRRQFPARGASGSRPLARPLRRAFHPRRPRLSTRAFPPPRLSTRASSLGAMPGCCRVSSTMLVRRARHHAYLSTLTPQPDGYLCLEQSNECGSLPHRFGRAPHSLKVSSRGGVAAGVSGGREDDAAGDTAQGSGLVLGGRPSLGIVLGTPPNGLVGDSEDLAPRRA